MDDDNTLWQPVEPTTPVSKYPYEPTVHAPNPYEDYVNIPPPPPKRRRKVAVTVGMVFSSAVLLFCSVFLFSWAYTYHVNTTQPTPIVRFVPATPTVIPYQTDLPTAVPSPTPLPGINTAQDVYAQFLVAGIAMLNPSDFTDDSWWLQCCSYYPANGSVSFLDVASDDHMLIALFATVSGAQEDAAQVYTKHDYTSHYQKGRCLLLYEGYSNTNLVPYEQVMQQYCA